MRSKKNKKKLMIAITLGTIATTGVFSMMNSQKASIQAQLAQQQAAALATMQAQQSPVVTPQEELTNVILAKTDIKSGEIITITKIERKEYKKSELPPNYFFNENFVLGKTASQDILTGKIITVEDLAPESQSSIDIPPGMRAITIPTSLIQGLASYIYVGSKIDLVAVKSPPEFIAQNIKIVAFETVVDPQAEAAEAAATAAAAATTPPAAPAAPAQAGQPVAAAATPTAATVAPVAAKKSVSADKAAGITILVPISTARKVIDAMIAGKLQIITRGRNDDKIYRQTSYYNPSSSSSKGISKLPPPPSGTGSLPSLPGGLNPPSTTVEQPKTEVEVITGSSKSKQSFDDTNGSTANLPSKDLKDLLKLPN